MCGFGSSTCPKVMYLIHQKLRWEEVEDVTDTVRMISPINPKATLVFTKEYKYWNGIPGH